MDTDSGPLDGTGRRGVAIGRTHNETEKKRSGGTAPWAAAAAPVSRHAARMLAVAAALAMQAGCGTTRWSDTSRTATEQLVVSNAVDQAISHIDFQVLAGKTVFFDGQYLDGVTDKGYVTSSLRQQLLANGCMLQDDRQKADYIVEARSGAVGTDRHDLLFGIPQMTLPTLVPGMPAQIPELAAAKKTNQIGVAKIAVFAYNRKTGEPVWQSGVARASSKAKNLWVLGAGPIQSGTVRDGINFAGESIELPLVPLVTTKPPREREPAGQNMAAMQQAVYTEHGDLSPDTLLGTRERPGAASVPVLIEVLKDKASAAHWSSAALAIADIGPGAREAVPALIEVLKGPDVSAHWAAAHALGEIGPEAKEAVGALIEAIKDKNTAVHTKAVEALGKIGPNAKAAVPALMAALRDPRDPMRLAAAEALGGIAGEAKEAVPALVTAMGDKEPTVSETAMGSLGHIGPAARGAVPALLAVVGDTPQIAGESVLLDYATEQRRLRAIEALGKIGPDAKPALAPLLAALQDFWLRGAAAEALSRIGPEAVPPLMSALASGSPQVRLGAADALGQIGEPARPALPALGRRLQDSSVLVRVHVAEAIWEIHQDLAAALPVLIDALKNEDRDVRAHAAEAMGHIGPAASAVIPVLVISSGDADPIVRVHAAAALWRIERRPVHSLPTLVASLKNADPRPRDVAVQTLKDMGPDARAAVPILADLIKDKQAPEQVRQSAADALRGVDHAAYATLMRAIDAAAAAPNGGSANGSNPAAPKPADAGAAAGSSGGTSVSSSSSSESSTSAGPAAAANPTAAAINLPFLTKPSEHATTPPSEPAKLGTAAGTPASKPPTAPPATPTPTTQPAPHTAPTAAGGK